ncbi:MAG TPA: hypothetical protein EYG03_22215, partial [Planctomycetes bacterium]|nr:hypothetical protein [Planctomycetota bacterium]
MKKLATWLLVGAATVMTTDLAVAQQDGDKPRDGAQERDRPREEGRGERGQRERGRDGDRPGDGERGRDGDRTRGGERGRPGGGPPRGGDGRRPPFGGPVMGALDRNHNGILESEEIDQAIVVLRRMDRNKDGRITADEMGAMGRPGGDRPPR